MASDEALVVSGNSSGATLVGYKRKRQGRRKIPIEPIQNEDARQVCFSKRRKGLFKKALELSVLCGAHVAVIANSPAGRPYSFIHPSNTPSVLDRYISSSQVPGHVSQTDSLTRQVSELNAALAAAKAKKETLKMKIDRLHESIWSADVNTLSLEELMVVRTKLLQIKGDLKASVEMKTHDSSGISVPNIGTSSNEGLVSATHDSFGIYVPNREVAEDEIDLELKL